MKKMCLWLSVSSSGFFDWKKRPASLTSQRRERLKVLVADAFTMSDETYGYRRIHAPLTRWGVPCGPELVRAIMRELDLQPCQPRPWRTVHDRSSSSAARKQPHTAGIMPTRLARPTPLTSTDRTEVGIIRSSA